MLRKTLLLATLLLTSRALADDFPESQKHAFPVSGVSLQVPNGSSLANTLPVGVLFDYWSSDKTLGMNVSITPVNNPSADQYASQLALQLHGTKEAWDEKIDGEPAFRVNIPVKIDKCSSRTSLITVHDGRALVITALGTDSDKSEEAARQLARSVGFDEPDSPAEHADVNPKVGFAFGEPAARVVISAPEWLHVVRSAGKELTLGGYDFTTGKEAFIAAFSYSDVPQGMHVAEYAAHMVPQMKTRFSAKDNELWASVPEDGRFYATPPLRLNQPSSTGPSLYKFSLVEVAPGRMLSMVFMINAEDPTQAKAYADLAAAMIKNIKLASVPVARVPAGPAAPAAQAAAQEK